MSLKVGKAVIEGVTALLADQTIGFNRQIDALSIDWNVPGFTIDFIDANSMTFLIGQVQPEALFESMDIRLPLMTLDSVQSVNQNVVKWAAFAGTATAIIDVHIDWAGTRVNDFGTFSNMIESGLYMTLNQQDAEFNWQAYGLLYNGMIGVAKSPIRPGARNWFRTVSAQMSFKIIK